MTAIWRQVPVHAGRRVHPDVRAHSGPPQHRGNAWDRLSGREADSPISTSDLYRADRRILRLPVRKAALPFAVVQACDLEPRLAPIRRGRQLPPDERLYACDRIQASNWPEASEDQHHLRISV